MKNLNNGGQKMANLIPVGGDRCKKAEKRYKSCNSIGITPNEPDGKAS